jgi:hypothetical protein
MASIVLGESDPFSKVCLAIHHVKSKIHVYEIVVRLIESIFERTLGPYDLATLHAKSEYVGSLLAHQDIAGTERLQRVVSDSEKLEDEHMRRGEVVHRFYQLGCILLSARDFTGAKKNFRNALHLSRLANGE